MAIGGFLGGLANLGTIAGGAQQYQTNEANLDLLRQFQQSRALALQQAQQEQQAQNLLYPALQQLAQQPAGPVSPPGAPPIGPVTAPGMPDYSPGAVQAEPLPPLGAQPIPDFAPGQFTTQMSAPLAVANLALQHGFPPAGAAGIAGGLTGESGLTLNPQALNPRSGALGQAQWLGPRKQALLSQPDPLSRQTQNNFMFGELAGPEAATGQALMSQTDPAQAANIFTTQFERPSAQEAQQTMAQRQAVARQVYAQIAGGAQQLTAAGAPPQATQHSSTLAAGAINSIDPSEWGRSSIKSVIDAIDKTAGNAPPAIKAMAAMQLMKLMQPSDQNYMRYLLQANRESFQEDMTKMRLESQQQLTDQRLQMQQQLSDARLQMQQLLEGQRESFRAGESAKGREYRSGEAEKARQFRSDEAQKTRDAQMERLLKRAELRGPTADKQKAAGLRAQRQRATDEIARLQAGSGSAEEVDKAMRAREEIDDQIIGLASGAQEQPQPSETPPT